MSGPLIINTRELRQINLISETHDDVHGPCCQIGPRWYPWCNRYLFCRLCWCLRSVSHLEVMMRSVVCDATGDHIDVHYSFWVCMDVCVTEGSHVEVLDSCCCWLWWAVKHLGWYCWGLQAPTWELKTLRAKAFIPRKGKWHRWKTLRRVLKDCDGDIEM